MCLLQGSAIVLLEKTQQRPIKGGVVARKRRRRAMKGIYSTLAPRVDVVAVVAEPVADGGSE